MADFNEDLFDVFEETGDEVEIIPPIKDPDVNCVSSIK